MLSTGAVLTHDSNPNSLEFTLEELQAGVSEAKNFGLRVMVHAHATEGHQERDSCRRWRRSSTRS